MTVKHFERHAKIEVQAAEPVSALGILEDRKAGLEDMIRARFRAARAGKCDCNVANLSAALRKVKADIATCGRAG